MGKEMIKEFLSVSNLLLAFFCVIIGLGHGLMLTQGELFERLANPFFGIITAISTSTYYALGLHVRHRHQRERMRKR